MPAFNVSPVECANLRAQAHALKPVVHIGAEGLTEAVLAEIKVHLAAHQLIKIRVLGDERENRVAIYEEICKRLNAAPIQHIGKLLVIFKPEAPPAKRPARASGASESTGGGAPRLVKVIKPTDNPGRRPRPQQVLVRGNERVTAGGNVKRAKKRQTSAKRKHQAVK